MFFQSILVLVNGTVIDGTGAPPRANAVVEITDDRIARVSTTGGYEIPEGADVVDMAGKWLLPGLIDTHTHLLDSGSLYTSPDDYDLTARVPHDEERRRIRDRMPATLASYLCAGVTTVASLGGPRWELDVARATKAPHVVSAGPFLANFPVDDVTLWTREDPALVELESPEHARAKVRELEARGVDLIEVGFGAAPGLTREEFTPVTLSSTLSAMHAEELETAKMAVRAGVDVLAHTVVDRVVDDELDDIPEAERPEMPSSIQWGSSAEARTILQTNVRKMYESGITLAAGSNGGNIGTLQGPSFHRELHRMADAGVPLDAIVTAATRDAARALGLEDDRGTLTAGKLADGLVLSADPLEHVDNFAAIDAVYVAGTRIQARLQKRPRVPAEPMSYRGAPWLEREDRYEEERPELVLDAMELEPGDVVADVGTGSGFYARQIATRVMPGGRVYAVDIQPEMLELLRRLVEE